MAPRKLRLVNPIQFCFLGLWSVIWISVALVLSIFSRHLPLALARRVWAPPLVWAAQARMQVDYAAPIDPGTPYVYIMNHQSMLDIAIAFTYLPSNLHFVAKHVLAFVPFLGWYMWRTGMIFVDRANRKQALAGLQRAGRKVREGSCILAYPEGTRSRDGRILPFKKGPFVVAIESGVPIVPVVVHGSGDILPAGTPCLMPSVVRLSVGEPIPTAGLGQAQLEDLIKQVRDAMIDLHVAAGGPGGDKEAAIALPGKEGIGRPLRQKARAA